MISQSLPANLLIHEFLSEQVARCWPKLACQSGRAYLSDKLLISETIVLSGEAVLVAAQESLAQQQGKISINQINDKYRFLLQTILLTLTVVCTWSASRPRQGIIPPFIKIDNNLFSACYRGPGQ